MGLEGGLLEIAKHLWLTVVNDDHENDKHDDEHKNEEDDGLGTEVHQMPEDPLPPRDRRSLGATVLLVKLGGGMGSFMNGGHFSKLGGD